MICVQFKYCTSHNFSQKLLINYQSSQCHCSIAAVRGPSSNVRWQWKPKSSSFFMMLPMWEVLLKRKKPALHLLSSLTWVLVSYQYLCPNKYQNHVWIKTLIFSPESSVELGISLFSPSLINPNDQIPDQEVSAEVLWAPLWLMVGCLAADSVPSFGSKSNSFTCKVNTSLFFIIHTVIAIIITTSWSRNPCH